MLWVYGHYKYFTLSMREPSESDVYRRQNVTSKVDPRTDTERFGAL